jgi:hypothetical protein
MASILRPIPIFDTNIFGHVQDGSISQKDWRFLLRHRPGHGWPLSIITALELLAGFQEGHSDRFSGQKKQIELAYQLSKGHIHEEPCFLFCKKVLHVPFPHERLPVNVIDDHIRIVLRAQSLADILGGRVTVNKLRTKGQGHSGLSGFQSSALKEILAGPKNAWKQNIEGLADENYARWSEHFQETGKRLPDELREDLRLRLASDAQRMKFAESFVRSLGGSTEPASVADMTDRLGAALAFTIHVLREFLLGQYKLEKHHSDVYDQFQLRYLTLDRFIIVSEDSDLTKRTVRSNQANRILPFETFLRSL